MPEVKVSGVPYSINMTPNFKTIQESIDYYEEQLRLLRLENKALKARQDTLTAECEWLESLTRRPK